jgi:hypothetical protein
VFEATPYQATGRSLFFFERKMVIVFMQVLLARDIQINTSEYISAICDFVGPPFFISSAQCGVGEASAEQVPPHISIRHYARFLL